MNVQMVELGSTSIEIIDGDRGRSYPQNHELLDSGYCLFLSAKNVTNNGFDFSECQFISKEKNELLRKGKLQRNDIVLTTRGTLGNIAFFGDKINFENMRINSGMVILRVDGAFDPYFFYSFLKSRNFKVQIKKLSSGSAQPQFPIKDLIHVEIPNFPIEVQMEISKIIKALDDKISLLRRQNETLEQIAQEIFRHWFVDFEFPDEHGKPYKSSGGRFVSSELGDIPEGWQVGKLGDEFEIVMGQSPPGESYNEDGDGVLFFQGRTDFGFRFPQPRLYTNRPKRMAEKFDILVSVRAPVGDINLAFSECCIGRGLSAVKSINKSYCLYKLKSLNRVFGAFESEGTVFGALNKNDFNNIRTITPGNQIIDGFEKFIQPIDQKIYNSYLQIQKLHSIKEILLPRLMSGEIRVK